MRNAVRITIAGATVLALSVVAADAAAAQGRQVVTAAGRGSATLSAAIRSGNMIYASGQLPAAGDSTIEGQTTSTLNRIKTIFEAAGTSMDNAVKCTVFLINVNDFRGMNTAYAAFWSPEKPPPARSTVVVAALVVPNAKLEIECMAALP